MVTTSGSALVGRWLGGGTVSALLVSLPDPWPLQRCQQQQEQRANATEINGTNSAAKEDERGGQAQPDRSAAIFG